MATQESEYILKYGYPHPANYWMNHLHRRFYYIYKELIPHQDKIHLMYAGAQMDCRFSTRPKESVAEEIREMYSQGKTNFIFDNLDEGVMIDEILLLDDVMSFISDILPNISVFYATGAHDADHSYDRLCSLYNRKKQFNIISCASQSYNAINYLQFKNEYNPGPKEKKFLCFNKREAHHRVELLEKLLELDLVKDSFYSFGINQNHLEFITNTNKYPNIVKIKDQLPLVLNINENRHNPIDLIQEDLKYFEESYFSVVTETFFYENKNLIPNDNRVYLSIMNAAGGIFPTEKIYKCIAVKHPFVVLSTAGYLKELKNFGFKTFSPLIDESYDDIEDDELRLAFIVNEINRLCKLTEKELIEFTYQIKDIVEFNFNFLNNLSDRRITKNVLDLLK